MYRESKKREKVRSIQGVAARDRIRMEHGEDRAEWLDPDDDVLEITVKRKLTGETAEFYCTRGNRVDNYRVYCNDVFQGVQSITTLTKNIRKALPAFRRDH